VIQSILVLTLESGDTLRTVNSESRILFHLEEGFVSSLPMVG